MALLGRSGLSWPAHGDLCGCATPRVVRRGTAAEVHVDGMYGLDMAVRLEVDGLAMCSSASTKSRSLELLLVLHTLLGAAVLQRTNECSSSGRGRCAMLPPSELRTRTWCGSAQLKWRSQQPLGRASVAALAQG